MKSKKLPILGEAVKRIWHLDELKPLQISVMGQTGVGKTSLVNALFGTDFKVSSIRPETLTPQPHTEKVGGCTLEFWDLPGLGEARNVDQHYTDTYREKLLNSHIVIWAIHADSHSFRFDRTALEELISSIPDSNVQVSIMNKIIFILTKVDLLIPSPWILRKAGSQGRFTPRPLTERLLIEKEHYFQEAFLAPFSHLLKARTYRSGNFSVKDEYFDYDEHTVYYKGWMSESRLEKLCQKYSDPEHQKLLKRLYKNYRVIPCSSHFRFNLDTLMGAIVDKLEAHAIASFEKLKPREEPLSVVHFSKAKHFGNMVVFDDLANKIYDLSEMDYSPNESGG